MYILFCFVLFIVLSLTDICTFEEVSPIDHLLNFMCAFVPIVNFFIAFKLALEFGEYLFVKTVDKIWDKF